MLVHSLSCKYALKKVSRRWGEDGRIWKALGIGCTLENDHVFFKTATTVCIQNILPILEHKDKTDS